MDDSAKQPTVFDTDQQELGDVYAKALLGFGKTAGNLDQLVDELDAVVAVVQQVPGMRAALESPRIALEDKTRILEKAFGGRIDQGLANFLQVIGAKGRFDCLSAIASAAREMQDEISGRVQAVLTSASNVDEAVKNNISKRLSSVLGKTVSLKSEVDPTIIGGMVVRIGDTVYDGSVENQLAQVRTKTVKRAADAIREKLDRFASS